MKNKYEDLELNIVLFENNDIVTASGKDPMTDWEDIEEGSSEEE